MMVTYRNRILYGAKLRREEELQLRHLVTEIEPMLNNLYPFDGRFTFYAVGNNDRYVKNSIKFILVASPIIMFYDNFRADGILYLSGTDYRPPLDMKDVLNMAKATTCFCLYKPNIYKSTYSNILEMAMVYKNSSGVCRLEFMNKIISHRVTGNETLTLSLKDKYTFIKEEFEKNKLKFQADDEWLRTNIHNLVLSDWYRTRVEPSYDDEFIYISVEENETEKENTNG